MDPTREFADHILDAPRSPMVHLAQELVDHTIDFLHDDPAALLRVSLVSRVWVGRSRKYLCESLKIDDSKFLSSNPSHLTPLCKYVKTLHLTWPTNTSPSVILDCFERSGLHTLVIHSYKLHTLHERTMRRSFAKFPCTSITALQLQDISPAHRPLLLLLSLLLNADDLSISANDWKGGPGSDDKDIIQRISPPRFRGSFKSFDPPQWWTLGPHRSELLRTMAALPIRFQTVSLDIEEQSRGEVGAILNSCSETVRRLFVTLPVRSLYRNYQDRPNHFNLMNLEELRIYAPFQNHPLRCIHTLVRLIHLVTSPCLRRVVVEVANVTFEDIDWDPMDEALVDLVERHKAYGNLVFQISTTADPEKFRRPLPRAVQEGMLEVRFSKRPDYYTD